MPESPSIPVPVITSMSTCVSVAIAFSHRKISIGMPTKILLTNRRMRLVIGASGISLIGEADILYADRVSSGSEQMQLISASGAYFRMLYRRACNVHSFPKFPSPKYPKRAIFGGVVSVLDRVELHIETCIPLYLVARWYGVRSTINFARRWYQSRIPATLPHP